MPEIDECRSDGRWRSIIQSAVDAVVLIEAFNRAAERLFGYGEAEVLGRHVSLPMPPPYRLELALPPFQAA